MTEDSTALMLSETELTYTTNTMPEGVEHQHKTVQNNFRTYEHGS